MTTATAIKERPILFSGPMVRAILEGRKTQTRRIVKPGKPWPGNTNVEGVEAIEDGYWQFRSYAGDAWTPSDSSPHAVVMGTPCDYGRVGDRLWVREKHLHRGKGASVVYAADFHYTEAAGLAGMYGGWRPSIHMRRKDSRITLEITGVRVERLNDISEADAKAEGVEEISSQAANALILAIAPGMVPRPFASGFATLWESINGAGSWAANPWVWVVEFVAIEPYTYSIARTQFAAFRAKRPHVSAPTCNAAGDTNPCDHVPETTTVDHED